MYAKNTSPLHGTGLRRLALTELIFLERAVGLTREGYRLENQDGPKSRSEYKFPIDGGIPHSFYLVLVSVSVFFSLSFEKSGSKEKPIIYKKNAPRGLARRKLPISKQRTLKLLPLTLTSFTQSFFYL